MIEEQMNIYDIIISSVNDNCGGLFFLYGYGGTSKTFIRRAISAAIRSKEDIVLTVASSGTSSLLIPGGRATHSRFAIPRNIIENSACRIKSGDPLVELIVKSKLIIWDDAHMVHKHCFEVVDESFRDILRISNPRSMNLPFEEKLLSWTMISGKFFLLFQKGRDKILYMLALTLHTFGNFFES